MLKDTIQKDMTGAMKKGDKRSVQVLRFILSEINYAQIKKGQSQMTDEDTVGVLKKEVKKRKDAIEMFVKGNRSDLVKEEELQLTIIFRYIPKGMESEDIEKAVDEVIASVTDTSNPGKVIGMVMGKLKGKADGATVAQLVRKKLEEKNK